MVGSPTLMVQVPSSTSLSTLSIIESLAPLVELPSPMIELPTPIVEIPTPMVDFATSKVESPMSMGEISTSTVESSTYLLGSTSSVLFFYACSFFWGSNPKIIAFLEKGEKKRTEESLGIYICMAMKCNGSESASSWVPSTGPPSPQLRFRSLRRFGPSCATGNRSEVLLAQPLPVGFWTLALAVTLPETVPGHDPKGLDWLHGSRAPTSVGKTGVPNCG